MSKKHYPYLAALAFVALFLMLVVGCETRADRAAAYNDTILYHQVRIVASFNDLDESMNDIEMEQMQANFDILKGRIKEGKRNLTDLGPFNEDSSLLNAASALFRTYDETASAHYAPLMGYLLMPDSLFTPEVQEAAFVQEQAIYETLSEAHKAFEEAQRNFGEQYNLKFEKP